MTFADDVKFLSDHGLAPIVLRDADGGRAVVLAEYQGRVMTSAVSENGYSCGWINRELIASGCKHEHINAYGGEDRFWIGPEGSQFSCYFAPGAPFDFAHWQVPAVFDTLSWRVEASDDASATFSTEFEAVNWSGFTKHIAMSRRVTMLDRAAIAARLAADIDFDKVKVVGCATENTIVNAGDEAWNCKNGAVSVWMLGMFNCSNETRILVPFNADAPGAVAKDDYFGPIPAERLAIDREKNQICFLADGKFRSKIGLSAARGVGRLGSYDPVGRILSVVTYSQGDDKDRYVNAAWGVQEQPFVGDAVNAYNDGPLDDGSQMGPFYELESSSPAAFLAPGEARTHTHITYHFAGDEGEIARLSEKLLCGK